MATRKLEEVEERIKKARPDSTKLHDALDQKKRDIVEKYLDDVRQEGMFPRDVVRMIDEGRTAELRTQAQARVDLLNDLLLWMRLTSD